MKRAKALSMVALIFTLGLATAARAEHFGPIRSAIPAGEFSLGIGYAYNAAEWDFLEIRQNQAMLEASLGLGKNWVAKLRGGAANMRIENGFYSSDSRFEGDPGPFAEAYLGGPVFRGKVLSVGPFVHGSYTPKYEDDTAGVVWDGTAYVPVNESVTLENLWRATAGLTFQLELEGAALYFGPTYSAGGGNYESVLVAASATGTIEGDVEPDNPLAAFAGIRWQLPTEDWPAEGSNTYLDLETRMTGDLSVSAMLYFTF